MVDGIVLLDKPAGLSSNAALQRVRRAFGAARAGHVGSLDPLATGMLPVCLGEATKVAGEIVGGRKSYRFTVQLGTRTATGDMEGEPVETAGVPPLSAGTLRSALGGFLGKQLQVPPMYSALKKDGRPLYELARQGIEVERAARTITIHALDLLAFAAPVARIRVRCSKGTYIRTLAEDIGRVLGCGAHLSGLRRERVGAFGLDDAVTIERLDAMSAPDRAGSLLPADFMLADLAVVELDEALARRFLQGQRLRLNGAGASRAACATGTRVRVYRAGRLLGTAVLEDGLLVPQRLIGTVSEPPPSAASSPLQSDLQP